MIYNKSRNNLFGPLYYWKKLERCVSQGSPRRIISARATPCSKNNWSLENENVQSLLDSRSTFQSKYEKQFWKATILYFLIIYDSFRNNLFATPCRMVKSSQISGISIDLFQVLVAGRYHISFFCRFSLDIPMKTSLAFLKRGMSQLFMIYNKSRNNLFGPLYHLKETREMCLTRESQADKRSRHPMFEKQLVAGKWNCSKSSGFSLDISMKTWETVLKS